MICIDEPLECVKNQQKLHNHNNQFDKKNKNLFNDLVLKRI